MAQRGAVGDVAGRQRRTNPSRIDASAGVHIESGSIGFCTSRDNVLRGDFAGKTRLRFFESGHYLEVSMNVTLLISFRVVMLDLTFANADSRRNRIPSSRAALRTSE